MPQPELDSASSAPNTESFPAEREQAGPTTTEAWSYHHLVGKVGEQAITMELSRFPAAYENGGYRYHGFYRYHRIGGPISVYGSLDSAGVLVLFESGGWDGNPHQFQGQWSASGWQGEWTSGDGERVLSFSLAPAGEGDIVPFVTKSLQDSFIVRPQWAESPRANYQVDWVAPQAASAELNRFLEHQICRGIVGDSLARRHQALEAALVADKRAYFESYREETLRLIKEGLIDTLEMDLFHSFSYDQTSAVFIYYNSPDLLTLGYNFYYYTGGAHGNYATSVASYDLVDRKVVTRDEVLLPGYETVVSQALEKAVRNKFRLAPGAGLSEVLFEDAIAPNDNFGLTDKGIFFVYPPYEIGPYALGEIELYVPFESIRSVVSERWLR